MRGGAILTDLADNVITVWRNKEKEKSQAKNETERDKESDVHMIVSKQRLTGEEGKVPLWFDRASSQYMQRESSKPRQWVAFSGQTEQQPDTQGAA